MLKELPTLGIRDHAEDISADIIIVNTCAFIESAKKEAIDNILDVAWLKKHRKLKGIICCGCLAERYREEVFTELPEVDAVVGTGSIHNIVKAVEEVWAGRRYISCEKNECLRLGGERIVTTPEYTAYIKIAEGCRQPLLLLQPFPSSAAASVRARSRTLRLRQRSLRLSA